MAETSGNALTDEERAELEELRAEKARRDAEEKARQERAELEALRAEREAVEERAKAAAPAAPSAPAQQSATPPQPVASIDFADERKSFGERMVTSADTDDDGIPTMPPAQKLIIAICLVAVVAFVIYTFL